MKTAVIALDGVVRTTTPGRTCAEQQMVMDGLYLYDALRLGYRMVVVGLDPTAEAMEWWVKSNGLRDYAVLEQSVSLLPAAGVAARMRADGSEVTMVVTASPSEAATALRDGFQTVLWSHARFARPEHRPEGWRGIREWREIEEEVAEQNRLRSEVAASLHQEV